jgi:predicted nucleotidyltransferase
MNRDEINEYDLGLPVPIAPLEERRRGVPPPIWAALRRLAEALAAILGDRLRPLVLFGSYARNQHDEESDVDVLVLVEELRPGDRDRIIEAAVRCSTADVILAPLILTVAELDDLRTRELLIAQDIDREGIVV